MNTRSRGEETGTVLEVNDAGGLTVPASLLPVATPHSRYVVLADGKQIILAPASEQEPFWKTASTEEWLASFNDWIARHHDGRGLSREAVSRESIYE